MAISDISDISDSGVPLYLIAKTCRCEGSGNRKIAYSFVDIYPTLCTDKREIIISQILACEKLSKHTINPSDKNIIETEIAELKMTLDLLP